MKEEEKREERKKKQRVGRQMVAMPGCARSRWSKEPDLPVWNPLSPAPSSLSRPRSYISVLRRELRLHFP